MKFCWTHAVWKFPKIHYTLIALLKCNQGAINESPHKNNCTWLAFSKVQWKRNENEADVESIWGKFQQNIFKTEIEFGWKRIENENFALQPWDFFEKIIKIFKNMMHFWCTMMHFWCTFIGFWCTFDALSKVHQKCITFSWWFWWISKKKIPIIGIAQGDKP